MKFKTRLASMRKERGLTQEQLAKKAKLQNTAISHYERGEREPSLKNFINLCKALQVSADFLIGQSDWISHH